MLLVVQLIILLTLFLSSPLIFAFITAKAVLFIAAEYIPASSLTFEESIVIGMSASEYSPFAIPCANSFSTLEGFMDRILALSCLSAFRAARFPSTTDRRFLFTVMGLEIFTPSLAKAGEESSSGALPSFVPVSASAAESTGDV